MDIYKLKKNGANQPQEQEANRYETRGRASTNKNVRKLLLWYQVFISCNGKSTARPASEA